jgi:hypothetical protein
MSENEKQCDSLWFVLVGAVRTSAEMRGLNLTTPHSGALVFDHRKQHLEMVRKAPDRVRFVFTPAPSVDRDRQTRREVRLVPGATPPYRLDDGPADEQQIADSIFGPFVNSAAPSL